MSTTDGPVSEHDYGDDASAPTTAQALDATAQLDQLANMADAAARRVAKAEVELKEAKAAEAQILERDLPTLMGSMRMTKVTTQSGLVVELARAIRASLPSRKERPEDRDAAIAWLEANGHSGVIKNAIEIELDRGQDERANALVAELQGRGFTAKADKDVPHQTLGALVRELLNAGRAVPGKILNVFDQQVAKIKRK